MEKAIGRNDSVEAVSGPDWEENLRRRVGTHVDSRLPQAEPSSGTPGVRAMRRLRLRITVRRMMVAVAIAAIVVSVAKSLFVDNRPGDVLFAIVATLCGRHSTEYAIGYSESGFRSLRVGMTVRQ